MTDAVKRAARCLGPSMGLALYDKAQSKVAGSEAPFVEELELAGTVAEIDAITVRARAAASSWTAEEKVRMARAKKAAEARVSE